MEKVQIHIALMSQTPLGHGKESGNYSTTIPLDVSRKDALAEIEEIVKLIAEQINTEWCNAKNFDVTKSDAYNVYHLMSPPTRDINGNCYCFTTEYTNDVIDFVENYLEWDIEIEV